ncbi:MAG: apolipoprotein N-acyltransferase [Nitratireductor sp.]
MTISTGLERLSGKFILLWGWKRAGAAFAAGAVSALGFAPFNLFPLLFATIPVLVWLMDATAADPSQGMLSRISGFFRTGWWFGFGFFLAGLWWVGNAFLVEADEFAWMLPIAIMALPAALAMFTGLATAVAGIFWRDGWGRLVLLSVCLAGSDYLRGTLFTGFPWNVFGYAAMPVPVLMQSAALIGTYGVGLLALMVFSLPAALATPLQVRGRGWKLHVWLCLLLGLAHPAYGAWVLYANPQQAATANRVRIVQPAIDQSMKWSPESEADVFKTLLDLSTSTGKEGETLAGSRLLIWPESAFPFVLTERRDAISALAAMIPDGTKLVAGALRVEKPAPGASRERVFNSVFVIDANGEIVGASDKTHLVPFGEYLPFEPLMASLGIEQLTHLRGGFEEGTMRQLLDGGEAGKFLPLICYEAIFPGQAVPVGIRPDWLLNLTNDAWFGFSPGPFQHWQQARIRGVEEGLPMVRAANDGISSITDAQGRIVAKLGLGERGILDAAIPELRIRTLYSRYGNLILGGMLLFLFIISLFGRRQVTNRPH